MSTETTYLNGTATQGAEQAVKDARTGIYNDRLDEHTAAYRDAYLANYAACTQVSR